MIYKLPQGICAGEMEVTRVAGAVFLACSDVLNNSQRHIVIGVHGAELDKLIVSLTAARDAIAAEDAREVRP